MSQKPGGPRAKRCLLPPALKDVFRGVVPSGLALDLNLPPGTTFGTLVPTDVEVGDGKEDRRLVGHLTALASHAINAGLDLSVPAFPQGPTATINLAHLPLHTRTRNCLKREGLLSVDALQRLSLGELLAIRAFGVTCLVDLLTAVEADQGAAIGDAVTTEPFAEFPETEAVTPSPRLTREARLMGSEPWSKDVSLFDVRFGHWLLKDEEAIKVVREALVTGRINLDQRLCPEPPRWDIDLLLCPLESRTRNLLRETGLTTLGALAPLTLRAVKGSAGFGVHSLADLLAMLDLCRMLSSANEPISGKPALADFCRAVVDRARDPWFPDRLADRIDQSRSKGIRCLSLPLAEELSALAASTRESPPDIVIKYLGWDGRSRRTGEKVGSAQRWTSERVRKIVSRLKDQLAHAPTWAPTLSRALGFCERAHPLPAEEIAIQLQQNGLATGAFHPRGLITAAEVIGLTHTLSIRPLDGADWLIQGDQRMLLRKSFGSARSIVAARGVCSVAYLKDKVSERVSRLVPDDTLRAWLLRLPDVHWLDEERQWFRFTKEGGSLETILWKILAVAPELRLGELRVGLMRHHRSPVAPPFPVLIQLCRHLGLEVNGDLIRTRKPIRAKDVLTEDELAFFEILSAEGPLLPRNELQKRCLQRGVNPGSFMAYLSYSPILARYARGIHGLRGARIVQGEEEALRRRLGFSRNVTRYGWKKSGVPWIAYRLSGGTIRSGVVNVPADMRDAFGEGRWPLLTVDGMRVGDLVCRRGFVWGLRPEFRRRGANVGDIIILEIDRKTGAATIRLGGPELLVQVQSDMNVRSDSADGD